MPAITDIKDFGINVGAPIIQDKLWAWLYFGVQDIKTRTELDTADNTLLQNMGLKINYQPIPENRAEIYFSFGKKNKWGRSASFTMPGGYFQDEPQHFGNPIHKFQDEHMFGNDLFVSAKYVYANVGFGLTPMADLDFVKVPWYDETLEQWKAPGALGGTEMGSRRYEYIRPVKTTAVRTTYFNDDLLGASHEVLLGVEYNYRAGTTDSEREGHMDISWNMDWGSIADFNGDGNEQPAPDPYFLYWDIDRYMFDEGIVKHYQAYIRDTISFGNFNILAGLRYDIQQPYSGVQSAEAVYDHPIWTGPDAICTPTVRDAIEAFLPAVEITQDRKVQAFEGGDYNWTDLSPRLGLTWDIFGNGRTIAKVSYSRYSSFMDIDYGEDWRPGGFGGDIQLWWDDTIGTQDWVAEANELFWTWSDSPPAGASGPYQLYRPFADDGTFIGVGWPEAAVDAYGINYSGFTYGVPWDPTGRPGLSRSNTTGSTHTTEIQASIERELMPDLGITLNFSWRRYDNFRRTNDLWVDAATGETLELSPDMYVEGYEIPGDISAYMPADFGWDGILPSEAFENPWYFRTDDYAGTGVWAGHNAGDSTPFDVSRPDDSWNEWYGVDIILNKRFSNKWMLNASATFQTQKEHYGATGVYDLTNQWANDGVSYSGGTFSTWMVKISGIYQLPYGFNVSGFFTAREGFKEDETFSFQNRYYASTYNRRDRSQTIYLQKDNAITLPTFAKLDLRVEKMVRVGDRGKAYIMIDLFNVFNSSTVLDKTSSSWGSFYYYGPGSSRNRFSSASHPNEITDILSPFIARFGVRFEF
jgi:hypothetical protein